jgi:hypothetical protein
MGFNRDFDAQMHGLEAQAQGHSVEDNQPPTHRSLLEDIDLVSLDQPPPFAVNNPCTEVQRLL